MVPLIACLVLLLWAWPAEAAPLVASALVAAGVGLTTATIIATVAVSLVSALASFALSALFRPGTPRAPELVRDLARPQSLPPYRFVYGRARVSGSPAPMFVRGANLYMCIILNSRPSDGFEAIWFDKRAVAWEGDPYDFAGTGATISNEPWASAGGLLGLIGADNQFWVGLGDQTSPPAELLAEAGDELLATDGWQGRTVIWLRLNAGPNSQRAQIWPRTPPEIEVLLRGCRVWNPNDAGQDPDNPATWQWDDTRALCLLDALRTNPVRPYPLSQIDVPSFQAATFSDAVEVPTGAGTERRYRVGGVVIWTDRELEDQVSPLVDAGGSRLIRIGGRLGLTQGVWVPPEVAINDVLDEGLSFERWRPGRDLATTIAATHLSPERDWQMAAVPAFQVPGAQAADGGTEVIKDLALEMVTSLTQAQRLAKIAAYRNRSQRRIRCVLPPRFLNLVAGVNVAVALPAPYALMNGTYEVVSMQPRLIPEEDDAVAASCEIELLEIGPEVFGWDASEERPPAAGLPVLAQPGALAAPVGLALIPGEAFATGDTTLPAIEVRVNAPTDARATTLEAEWRVGAGQWNPVAPLEYDRAESAATASVFVVPVAPGGVYEVRVRWAAIGQASAWVADSVTAAAPPVSLLAPTEGAATAAGADGINVSFRLPNGADVRGINFYRSLSNDPNTSALVIGPIFTGPNSVVTIADGGLAASTTYYYWGRTVGPFTSLSAFSASALATTDP